MRSIPSLMLPFLGLCMLLLIACEMAGQPEGTLENAIPPELRTDESQPDDESATSDVISGTPDPTPTPKVDVSGETPPNTPTPAPTPAPTPTPTPAPTHTPTPVNTPTPTSTTTPTSAPVPTVTPTPTPKPIPQPRELFSDVRSADNVVVADSSYTIHGTASPDATVSANGHLMLLESSGHFETNIPLVVGPNLIEVVASDLDGEVRSKVMTIVLITSENEVGLFGEVISVDALAGWCCEITLGSSDGMQTVTTTPNTRVEFPGRSRATIDDISVGDSLAILASESGGQFQALTIQAKPSAPVLHTHISGAVLQADAGRMTIMDRYGNVITAEALVNGTPDSPLRGQVGTVTLEYDAKTDKLTVMGFESAETVVNRLVEGINLTSNAFAETKENLAQRLTNATSAHLSTLQEYVNRVDPTATFRLAMVLQDHERVLPTTPTLNLSGQIQALNTDSGTALITPKEGQSVQISFTETTTVTLFGVPSDVENLQESQLLGQKIHSIYLPRTQEAITFDVIFPQLDENLETALIPQVLTGELEGTVGATYMDTEPPTLTVRPDPDRTVLVTITPDTSIRVMGQPANVQQLIPGMRVQVRYNPKNQTAFQIETLPTPTVNQRFTTGVVTSLIPKFGRDFPGQKGNISIATNDGAITFLTVTEDTIIEQNDLRMNILAIKFGDVVRPVSSYNAATGEIQRLVLRTPEFAGTVLGKLTSTSGRQYLTITVAESGPVPETYVELMTLEVSPQADVTIDSIELGKNGTANFDDLEVGMQIKSGHFNPFSLQITQLQVGPPKILHSKGNILNLNKETGVIQVGISATESVQVILPFKPGIVVIDDLEGSIVDLEPGDLVQHIYYRPDQVIVKMSVTSR